MLKPLGLEQIGEKERARSSEEFGIGFSGR